MVSARTLLVSCEPLSLPGAGRSPTSTGRISSRMAFQARVSPSHRRPSTPPPSPPVRPRSALLSRTPALLWLVAGSGGGPRFDREEVWSLSPVGAIQGARLDPASCIPFIPRSSKTYRETGPHRSTPVYASVHLKPIYMYIYIQLALASSIRTYFPPLSIHDRS